MKFAMTVRSWMTLLTGLVACCVVPTSAWAQPKVFPVPDEPVRKIAVDHKAIFDRSDFERSATRKSKETTEMPPLEEVFQTRREGQKLVLSSPVTTALENDDKTLLVTAPSEASQLQVDYQIGEKDGLDAYLRFFVSPEGSAASTQQLIHSFDAFSGYFVAAGVSQGQCLDKAGTCVKRCPNGKGGTYCCQVDCEAEADVD